MESRKMLLINLLENRLWIQKEKMKAGLTEKIALMCKIDSGKMLNNPGAQPSALR